MLNVPLAVRITSSAGDKHITPRLRDLSIRSVAPGGFASATLVFDQPLALTDPAVQMYGKLYVYDGRSGATIWEGRQEDPGRGSSADGQVWTLNAFGPSVHTEDRQLTVCYVDTDVSGFRPVRVGMQGAAVGTTEDATPSLLISLNAGTIMAATSAVAQKRILTDTGQHVGRFKIAWDVGVTDANFQAGIATRPSATGTVSGPVTANFNTAGGTLSGVITTNWATGDSVVEFRLSKSSASSTIADQTHWVSAAVVIQGTRYTATGAEITTGATYSADTVIASDIVKDLLGRVLNQFDGANAVVATTSFAIDQLSYPDPVTAGRILEDLMALESAYYWAAWESTSTGKARFEWTTWPTTVRYETSITGDFDSPGDVGELYNAALVRWTAPNGRPRSTRVTSAQTDLDAAGITREAIVDLGDNAGSSANATQAGTRFLADHNSPPNAGTLTVSTPILDLTAGRMVQPWEIRPGNLIRVRGVLPRIDALNATDRDAVTVFRIVATEYRAASNSCALSLDSYSRSLGNQIVEAHKRIDTLRRR